VGGELVHDVFPSGLIDPTAHLKTGKSRLSAPLPIDYGFVMLLPDVEGEPAVVQRVDYPNLNTGPFHS
jgi:hypothetical protein